MILRARFVIWLAKVLNGGLVREMGLEQKRTALRSVVRKIIWDGQNAHVYLCGIQDETIEFPEISLSDDLIENNYDESEELEKFDDVVMKKIL